MTSIIVTNDDGFDAPGIVTLAEAMRSLGEVRVCAPATNQSASGHKITLQQNIEYSRCAVGDGIPALVVKGSPADCIALSLLGLVDGKPDIVVSGINRGENMGQDLTYSGTVSAALEAAIGGIPAVAFSLQCQCRISSGLPGSGQWRGPSSRWRSRRVCHPTTILNVNARPLIAWRICAGSDDAQGVRIYATAWLMSMMARARRRRAADANLDELARMSGRCIATMSAVTAVHSI